ncbi:MAG: PEF-CTERM sorting domain-containing protein [Methanosarcinaceae archaeon]|nr:PEF-CTERM sorting domain-containing protein [Methanosarcinaceae archaeon]
MKKILLIAIVLIAMIGPASAGYGMSHDVTAFASVGYGISHDVTGPVTLDVGESQTFNVTVTGATCSSEFSVVDADIFTVTIDGTLYSGPVTWDGGTNTFEVVVTNDKGAGNGDYVITFQNDGSSISCKKLEATVQVLVTVIPEFPTIALPVAAILGLAFIFQRRREDE